MSEIPWSDRPKIDELLSTDILMRRVPTGGATNLNQEIPISDLQVFLQGSPIVNLRSADDLPILANGFSTLEQGKNYNFLEPFTIPNPILFPAGWVGRIESNFLTSEFTDYVGNSPLFSTLNINGIINSIADAGSGAITVTTSVTHGLLDDQFVNITGTTSYNQDRLVISNVSSFTFDVQIPFVADESGAFNTGYGSVILNEFLATNAGTADFMDLTAAPILGSTLSLSSFTEFGFLSPGIVRNAPSVIIDKSILGFITDGLTLQDCDTIGVTSSNFQSLSALVTNSKGLILTGALTRVFGVFGSSFTMTAADQRPVRIDSSIITAQQMLFQNSPDNNVGTAYFDTSSGGLDQTNPQVIAINNGLRPNSMSSAQFGFTNIATPIIVAIVTQDEPVIIGGIQYVSDNLERATVDTAGRLINLTKVTQKYPITFSGLIEKVGGGVTDIGILLIKNGVLDLTSTFEIPHSVNAGVIEISATRDFELKENETLDIAVVNFDGTSDIDVSQANVSYSVKI